MFDYVFQFQFQFLLLIRFLLLFLLHTLNYSLSLSFVYYAAAGICAEVNRIVSNCTRCLPWPIDLRHALLAV